jgi:DNA invertase Pin-like site-specific DNA recombinase
MKIGYARVSTKDQNLNLQLDALKVAGCEQIFSEYITGATKERPELQKLLSQLRPNDVIVIWKLDRLGRSLSDLVQLVNDIQAKGAGLLSLQDNIDTTTPTGKLTFHIFASIAEFERSIIVERTKAGLSAARARGRVGGRPSGLSTAAQEKAKIAEMLYKQGDLAIQGICNHLNIGKNTLYRYLRFRGVEIGK